MGSATRLPFEDSSLPCVVTDPPYYDNVNYAELSDFFYVWLKRSIGHLYPEALSGYATPKEEEAIFNPFRWGSAVTSTVLLVCRKRLTEETGWWEEIRPKLRERVAKQLRRFWRAGIRGADFLIAGIGPAVEVFGQFAQVKDYSGREVRIDQLLDEVHQVVWDYALRQILGEETAEGAIDNPTRFYVLARSLYNAAPFPYDEANRIAKALGVETDELAQRFKLARLARGRRNEMNVLTAQKRVEERAIRPDHPEMRCLIDALHLAQAAWEKGGRAGLGTLLGELGLAMSGEFWGVAQSLASLLPDGDSDRRQWESLLTAKVSLQEAAMQGRLF